MEIFMLQNDVKVTCIGHPYKYPILGISHFLTMRYFCSVKKQRNESKFLMIVLSAFLFSCGG